MKILKQFIIKNFRSFVYFYSFLKYRIFISIALSLLVGVLDGFGLAMFLPLLQIVGNPNGVDSTQMGSLSFLLDGFDTLGIELNLISILLLMLIFFILKGIFKFIEGYYRLILQLDFTKKIRFSNINLLSNFKYSAFVTSDTGRIQNTFSGEVEKVVQAYRNYFTAFQYGVLVFVYIFLAFLVNPQFALLVSIGGGLTNFIFKKFYFFTKSNSKKLTKELHAFQGLLIQIVTNYKYLKATGLVFSFAKKLKNTIDETQVSQQRIGILATWLNAIREPIIMIVIVSVILIQVSIFNQPLALIILSLLFFYRSLSFLMSLQNYWNGFLAVSGSLENMKEFTKILSKHQVENGTLTFEGFKNRIDIKSLNFFYGDKHILKNINLDINKNETIAFVGESGSGKTTLINILSGLLQIKENSYYIDNNDVCKLEMHSFHKRIGYITQEPVIFNDTVFNNITFWDQPTTENINRFEIALKNASIFEFVMSLPDKGNAYLGDNGIMISGGQKQRISIARELYKDIDILFMDEATSALDSQTEMDIQSSIDKLKGKYTIILVAHRLSTVKSADKIVYLSEGEICGIGDFDTLKSNSTGFKEMVSLQGF
ncbi:ABC transporter ATP-binding protein [Albibacterium bauzanense]|uniref:ATP-binding cassette, subfamily B, MsbA n=1 Tax=Albibacterium bauzanense TaxID=653929 RepID=A0A4R1M131_9SPHI|nr:ABC transporter ATP-binding protein [Albibacterium bauzanense]TCK84922.1 ATP-binding cassette, subfamily B, MsbA [Albibacterium bauzanense]